MSSTAEGDLIARQVATLLEVPSDETRIADYYTKVCLQRGQLPRQCNPTHGL